MFAAMWHAIRQGLKKKPRGFTIVESILSTVVVGIGLTGGMVAMSNVMVNVVQRDMRTIGSQLAQEKMEMVLSDHHNHGYNAIVPSHEKLTGDFAAFKRYVLVYEVSSQDLSTPKKGSGLKKVDIIVKWSQKEFIKLSTLVARI